MSRTIQRTLVLCMIVFLAQTLLGCDYVAATLLPSTPQAAAPEMIEAPHPDYADAQATIDAGNSQLSDLSRQGSQVDMEMAQTRDASAYPIKMRINARRVIWISRQLSSA